jgi:4-hydroxy-4-methyl-2-oxoglutarate aldolase
VSDASTRLLAMDACAVSDALDQLGLPSSVVGIAPLAARRRIAGRVVTARMAAGRSPEGASVRHLGTTAIATAEPGDIVVVEQATGIDCGGWGGILSTAAKTKGLAGVIVEGPCRDIDEAEELGFPVYARKGTARTARGRIHEEETGGPVTIGDTRVESGDWVIADASGIAFIPAARLDDVLVAAESIARKEAAMAAAVKAGQPVTDVMGTSYEHLLETK